MKTFLIFISLSLSISSIGQELVFTELGMSSAYCRLFDYQNGNGTVYASASGGTPDYAYLWEDLATGETSINATWGGLNPGMYQITVTDGVGDIITETIEVDSVNPTASFDIVSAGLSPTGENYEGAAPVEVTFLNTSEGFANPVNPLSDTTFFFRRNQFQAWQIYHTFPAIETYEYVYGGVNDVTLVAINRNGCADTATTKIFLTGSLEIDEDAQDGVITVTSHSIDKSVVINKTGVKENLTIEIYNLDGKLIKSEILIADETKLQLDLPKGIYLYAILNPELGELKSSGKFAL
jgi:hypothetical protein